MKKQRKKEREKKRKGKKIRIQRKGRERKDGGMESCIKEGD